MVPRTYRAETMAAALAKVKRDLGRQAVILRTRTVKSGGLFGVGAKTLVEISASTETNVLPRRNQHDSIPARGGAIADAVKGVAMPATAPPTTDTSTTPALEQELRDIKSLLYGLVKDRNRGALSNAPVELRRAYVRLIQNEVAEDLAGRFVLQLHDQQEKGQPLTPAAINEFLVQQLARLVTPPCPIKLRDKPGRCNVVALIGSTGVGKTTTVAKLAAQFRLKQGKKVGLVTIDTYRIAAVDQLRTYAKIIDVPLEVVLRPEDLRPVLERLRDCDIVFIDTAGRSQFDEPKMGRLKQFLDAAEPDETHLVLSATCSRRVLMKSIDKFSCCGVDRVIFTKMDEAVGVGALLGAIQKLEAKLSYITTGQDVPHDIEVGDGRRLAEMILQGAHGQSN